MTTYHVIAKVIEKYELEVEADSEEEAKELAENKLEGSRRHKYHTDSDFELEVWEE
jgi:hypothetical protein